MNIHNNFSVCLATLISTTVSVKIVESELHQVCHTHTSFFSYQEEQRAAIERKLEEKGRAEKEELRRERLELFNQRKERQAQIRRLTIKMARVKEVRRLGWINGTASS